MKIAPFKIAVFAVLALIAGFALGKLLEKGDGTSPSGPTSAATTPNAPRRSLIGNRELTSPSRDRIPAALDGALAEEAAWLDKIDKATLANLPALFAEAEEISGASLSIQVRHLLLIRWLELDPEDAYAAARLRKEANIAAGKNESNNPTFREFFRAWSRIDLDAALAAAAEFTDPDESRAAHQAIARGRIDIDEPLDYLELANSLPEGSASPDLYASALTRLAETDRERALAEAVDLPWNPRIGSLNALYAQWSAEDPHAALESTESLRGLGVAIRDRAIAALLPELALADPDLAGKSYEDLHAPNLNRGEILSGIVDALAEDDPLAAAQWFGKHGEKGNAHVLGELLHRTLLHDPAAAVDIYNAVQTGDGSAFIPLESLGDPASALDSIAALPDSFGKNRLQAGLISQWASEDFQAAAAYADSLPPNEDPFFSAGADLYRNPSDLDAAWSHASAIGGESSERILGSMLRNIARTDPDFAIRKYQSLPSGEFRDAASRDLASHLARSDPFKAADFVSTLPAGDGRNRALRVVSNSFAKDDPFATSEWIASFSPGRERDIATIELVNVVQQIDPQSAFIWAAAINDDANRHQSLNKVVRSWAGTDPAAAAQQIRTSNLPGARKTELLESLNPAD